MTLLAAASGWTQRHVRSCAEWKPSGAKEVVHLEGLVDSCIQKAPRGATIVFVAPTNAAGVLGASWDSTTSPWKSVDGHALRRLASGPLMELSSRYVDAVVCERCAQVVLVLGPSPNTVTSLVESVRVE